MSTFELAQKYAFSGEKLLILQFIYKKLAKNLFIPKKLRTFAHAFETEEHWRDGRVVDYSSLENYRAERHRGFESLSLRWIIRVTD